MSILQIVLALITLFLLILLGYIGYGIYKRKHTENLLKEVSRLNKEGRTDDAVHVLERDVKAKFDETKFLSLINLVLASGDFKKALEFFEKTEKSGHRTFNTEMMWAYTKFLSNDLDGAIKKYDKLLVDYKENENVINFNLASVLLEKEDKLDHVEKIYMELLDSGKLQQKFNIYINLGYAQMKMKKYEDAILNEKIALEQIPQKDEFFGLFALAHYVIGLSNLYLNKKEEAKNELEISKKYAKNKEFVDKINSALTAVNSSN
ncbi:hypothetical protein J7L48_10965 [bacterium]|nr:hypothetical protein [bacterium]